MFQFTVSREEFEDVLNSNPSRPIRVVRAGTARAVVENDVVVMRPTIVLRYSISVPTPHGGDVIHDEYVLEELWFADNEGFIDQSQSLLQALQRNGELNSRVTLIER